MSAPALVRLDVAAEAEPWAAAGFAVDGHTVKVGSVAIDLVGAAAGRRIVRWRLTDATTESSTAFPPQAWKRCRRRLAIRTLTEC